MDSSAYRSLGIVEAGRLLRSGEFTSEELTLGALAFCAETNPKLHAFITVAEERALDDARRADKELRAGVDRGPLHGIPYGVKDVFDTAGIRTTCHSKIMMENVPSEDSEVVSRLAQAGGVLLGKLATDEFAFGGPTEDLPFPFPLNPWNTDHMTGGSSSGSAVAVSSGILRLAIGTDTGGSIRGPAALCGLVGLKPTYGRVSTRGSYPLAYSMDHCGPLAATVEEAAIALQVLAGFDPLDHASADEPAGDYSKDLDAGVAGLRIGVPRAFFEKAFGVSQEALEGIRRTEEALRGAGAIVEDISLPDYPLFSTSGRVILTAEAFAVHEANLKARPSDYSLLAMQRIMLGASLTAADYIQALRLRRELARAVNKTFDRYDLILTACSLAPAPRLDSMPDPLTAPSVIQAYPFSLSGHPAMSVPIGLSTEGLPLSVQIVGPYFGEARVLRAGKAVEKLSAWKLPTLEIH